MSTEAYARSDVRENRIWVPFTESFPFNTQQTDDRIIIYGLYSGSHINTNKYLYEIEAVSLAAMLTDYNMKMAELTQQEQLVVDEITSKRYLALLDKAMHDEKMLTKRLEIKSEDDMATAKLAALATDTAALGTMAAKVDAERLKTDARIKVLQAHIATEEIQLSEVDIHIAEKEIQSAKVDIQKLDAANAVLKIQVDIVSKAGELVEEDLKIARTRVSVAETERAIAKVDLLNNELLIEKAQTDIAETEEGLYYSRNELAIAKGVAIDSEIVYQGVLLTQAGVEFNAKDGLLNLKHIVKDTALTLSYDKNKLENDNKVALSNLEVQEKAINAQTQKTIDNYRTSEMYGGIADVTTTVQAAIDAKKSLMTAEMATTLTHTIMKA